MKVVVDRGELAKAVHRVRGRDRELRLYACAGRVFVEANEGTVWQEALVLAEGSCFVPRVLFLKLVQSYKPKASITIEADANRLQIESTSLEHRGYSPTARPPVPVPVWRSPDASWMSESALKTYGLKDAASEPSSKPPVVPPKPTAPPVPPVAELPPKPKQVGPVVLSQWTETPDEKGLLWIGFACPQCKKQFQAKDGKQGKVMTCPQCGTELVIPGEKKIAPVPTVPVAVPPPPPAPSAAEKPERVAVPVTGSSGGAVPVEAAKPDLMQELAMMSRPELLALACGKFGKTAVGWLTIQSAATLREVLFAGKLPPTAKEENMGEEIRFNCPKCGQHLEVEARGAGVEVPCPKCGQRLTIPGADAQSAGEDKKATVLSVAATERRSGMNRLQKRILAVGLVLFALAGFFPSWVIVSKDQAGHTYVRDAGRSLVLSPPVAVSPPQLISRYGHQIETVNMARLDFQRLLVEWVLIGGLTAGGFMLARGIEVSVSGATRKQLRIAKIVGGVVCAGWFVFILIASEGFSGLDRWFDWVIFILGMIIAYFVPYWIARACMWWMGCNGATEELVAVLMNAWRNKWQVGVLVVGLVLMVLSFVVCPYKFSRAGQTWTRYAAVWDVDNLKYQGLSPRLNQVVLVLEWVVIIGLTFGSLRLVRKRTAATTAATKRKSPVENVDALW